MNSMSKRIAASAISALIAISMVQTATAGERTRHRAAATSEQVRNANASAAPFYVDQDEYSRYRNGGLSAPAGH
jgi:putative heme iron utilization protein